MAKLLLSKTSFLFISFCFLVATIHASDNYQKQKTRYNKTKSSNNTISDIRPVLIGHKIEAVYLKNSDNISVNLKAEISKKPTVLVFYRGGWCPYCSRQLSGLQDIEQELTKMGYQLLAISTDSPENLKNTETKEKLNYTLLSDADLNAAKKFGIAFRAPKNYDSFLGDASGGKNIHNLLPVPAVYILNKKGNIRFEYINPNISQRLHFQSQVPM
ncbi:AhpC/TSA family protein [bacterium]|nr:AhpC/TSA family protein [bacterium]